MRILSCLLLVLALAPVSAPAATLCDPHVGFVADRTLVIDGHKYEGKIWAMPGEERHEQAIASYRPIFLLHNGSPLGQAVVPQLKTVVEFMLPPQLRLLGRPELKKHPLGPDTVNGVPTTKYAIDENVPEGHAEGTLWLSQDGIPMKLAATFTGLNGKPAAIAWELSHVKIGPQPAALFEAPTGYSKLPAEALTPLLGLKLKSAKH